MTAANARLNSDVATRKAEWLRECHQITPAELDASPASVRDDIEHAWVMHWRAECEAGRGVAIEMNGRGARRAA